MIIDERLNEFLSGFYAEFPDFILRIRNEKDGNIAYYNGNAAFKINEVEINGEKKVELNFPLDVYKCNATDLSKLKSNKERAEYRKKRKDICMGMAKIYNFYMSEISFKLADKCDINKTKKRLETFYRNSIKYGGEFDLIGIQNNVEEIKKEKISLKFKEPITNINKIIMIQYYFIYDMLFEENKKKNDTIKNIKFNDYKVTYNNKKGAKQKERFIETIKKAIDSYTGKGELEKKYQHQFMLYGNKTNIFPKEENHTINHFEQEYYLKNKYRFIVKGGTRKNKEGRIDCIFYKIDETVNKITDIYLIELKVDETVVLGDNGVMTHLDDIKAIIKEAYEEKNTKWFKELRDRIEYRRKILINDSEYKLNNSKEKIDYNIHFYTIFGFTKDIGNQTQHRRKVTEYLKYLKDENEVKELCTKKKKDSLARLDEYFDNSERNNIYKLSNPIKDYCDIRFYYEKEEWEPDFGRISEEYENMTKELYNNL